MKQKKEKPYENQKIANLFMCKREIEKLREKLLGLIEQPCEDFQWRKKETVKIKSQYHQKSQLKEKTKNKTNKAELFSQKKICPCTKFWSQEVKKTKEISPFKKNNRYKIESKEFQAKNKIRTKKEFEENNLFDKETPKKYKINEGKKPNIFVSECAEIEPPLTVRKSNKKHRSVNTESTIDQISDKKLKSPQSVLLYSKTERVKFEENEDLGESFLLSQKSILPELALKNSRRESRGSKCSEIRIQLYEEKNNLEKSNCYVVKEDDSLLISGLNSKYWKGSSKKIADSIKSENQEKVNETNLFETQKENDRNMINRSLASKYQGNSDLIASWTLGNFSLGEMEKKPLSLDLIRKICEKTEKFMNSEIYPFREVLCDENEVENLKDSLALSRSLMKSKEKSYVEGTIGKLWIDEV